MSETVERPRVASYTRMDEGTVEDYALLSELAGPWRMQTAERVLAHMQGLHVSFPGNRITRYQHSLQTATRALRAGECEELVVASVLHDIGDTLSPDNHAEISASVLQPFVSRHTHWMLRHHGIFQGYHFWDKVGRNRDERERFRDHPAFEMTERFCGEYDQVSFDPDYDTLTLEDFEPMVRRIFARAAWGEHARSDFPA